MDPLYKDIFPIEQLGIFPASHVSKLRVFSKHPICTSSLPLKKVRYVPDLDEIVEETGDQTSWGV